MVGAAGFALMESFGCCTLLIAIVGAFRLMRAPDRVHRGVRVATHSRLRSPKRLGPGLQSFDDAVHIVHTTAPGAAACCLQGRP